MQYKLFLQCSHNMKSIVNSHIRVILFPGKALANTPLLGTKLGFKCWGVEFGCCGQVLIFVSNAWVAFYLLAWRFRCWRGTSVVGVALPLLAWRQRLLRTARITLILNSKYNILKYIKCNCSEAILFCKCK